jgi:hypothetical protein
MKLYNIPIKINIQIEVGEPSEHVSVVQETLLPKDEITVNGSGEPLPWEQSKKRGRGRPKKTPVTQITPKPDEKTEKMIYTLKNKLHFMDDQIEQMSFEDARRKIGEYYAEHPKLNG